MVSVDNNYKILLISVQKNLSAIGLQLISLQQPYYKKGYQSYLLHLPYLDFTKVHGLRNFRDFVAQIDQCSLLESYEYRIS